MNKLNLLILCLFACNVAFGQIEFGLKAGLSSNNLNKSNILNQNEDETSIDVFSENYGYHFGLYSRIKISSLYVEPNILFESTTLDYSLTEIVEDEILKTFHSASYTKLNIPLLIGMKFGFFRVNTGPVAYINLDSGSDLIRFKEYGKRFKEASYGLKFGIGVDFWKIRLDAGIEGNITRLGNSLNLGDESYQLSNRPTSFSLTAGYKF